MGKKTYLSQPIDSKVLHFLWKWKLATTSGLNRHIYSTVSSQATYHRLWRLGHAGFIKAVVDPTGKHRVWILTQKGFEVIQNGLPELKAAGFRSENPAHDLLASAIQLGDGSLLSSGDAEIMSEQEIRRIDPESYPTWVPRFAAHTPDGYWHLPKSASRPEARTVALEVELTQKRLRDYEKAARFYESQSSHMTPLWVVSKTAILNRIQEAHHKATDGDHPHNFVPLKEVLHRGWQAKLTLGPDAGKTMCELLTNSEQSQGRNVLIDFALDTRKTPYRSKLSSDEIISHFVDWIRL